MLRINVTTAEAVITETELITSGRKGLRCAFTFSDDWAGLAKTVIVQGAATRDIALLAANEITVPAECVSKAQFPLKIGVYGARPDGSIAIPTIWASFGKVLPGAKPSDIPPDELTPDVVAQIQEAANNALYLARNVQSMADSGALDGVSPAVTVTSITGGHNIKITDRDHPSGQDFDVPDGEDGTDGVSPTISSESITGGHRLTIVDAGGTTTVDVMDGTNGTNGTDGSDGVSPEVTIGSITGGHSVTITDADHPTGQTFNVMDGQDATVDATLSNSGEAADAAKTGEVKHTAEYALQFAETLNSGAGIPVDTVWQLGGFASDGTNENSRTYRARMKSRMSFPADVTFEAASGYQIQYVLWDSEGTWKSSGSWITSKTVSAGDLVRIGVRAYPEDTSITADPDVFGAAITIQNNIHAGMPTGGTTGQVLKKKSGTDYDTEWANESGGGSSDYTDLTNKPQIAGTTLSGNKSLHDLGIEPEAMIVTVTESSGNYSANKTFSQISSAVTANKRVVAVLGDMVYYLVKKDVIDAYFCAVDGTNLKTIVIAEDNTVQTGSSSLGTYSKPSGGIPASDLASAVQTSLGKADTALQAAPVTSVNGQTGAVTLSIPSTASDVGAVASDQGVVNANKVLTVGSNGMVSPEDNRFVVTMTPTAQDMSGVMDKTVAEIDEAYGAGKQVFFRVYVGTDYIETNVTSGGSGSGGYPSFNGFFITNAPYDAAVNLWTGTGASGNTQTYNANIYPLASGQWTGGSY